MKNKDNKLLNVLGESTSTKQAGVAFTLGVILPVLFSFVFFFVLALFGVVNEGMESKNWYLYSVFLIPQFSLCLIAVFCLKWSGKTSREWIKNQGCQPKYFVIAIILQIGLFLLSQLNELFLEFLGKFGYVSPNISLPSMEGFGIVGVLITVAILPAFFEELLFREILLKGVHGFGKVGCVLLCGGLFSLYHQNPAQTPYQFCCGVAYALLAMRAGSVLPTMLAHFCNNAFVIIVIKCFGEEFAFSPTVSVILSILSGICLLFSLTYLLFKDKNGKLEKENLKQKQFFRFAFVGIAVCTVTWLSTFFLGV